MPSNVQRHENLIQIGDRLDAQAVDLPDVRGGYSGQVADGEQESPFEVIGGAEVDKACQRQFVALLDVQAERLDLQIGILLPGVLDGRQGTLVVAGGEVHADDASVMVGPSISLGREFDDRPRSGNVMGV